MKFRESLPADARVFGSRLRVQWGDIDVAGIMYFAAYWRFAERAEMDLFNELGFAYDRVFDEYEIWLPRVHIEAQYHAPALMDDWIAMRTHVEKVGASSMRWKTVMFNERTGEPGAEFTLTVACMDKFTKKSRPLPDPIRDAMLTCVGTAG